jgi:anaerobic selenocysteine-containing dehydrogenase
MSVYRAAEVRDTGRMATTTLRTACPLDCPDTCTLSVEVHDGRLISVDAAADDAGNPLTRGYICQKVKHHAKRVYGPSRVLTPLIRTGAKGSGEFRSASWDEALSLVADRIAAALAADGPRAVFPYLYNSSGGIAASSGLTPALFAALGCPDIEHTICANTAGVAYQQVFDGMISADAQDLPHARTIVVWGANPQVSNTHLLPLLADAKRAGARLVVIDPRRTGVAGRADLHLAVRPGTDVLLAMAAVLRVRELGRIDAAFVAERVDGAEAFLAQAGVLVPSIDDAVVECGLTANEFDRFVELISGADSGPAMLRMGWGLERNRNGGSGIIAAYGLWSLLGHFGRLGSGVLQSQSGQIPASLTAAHSQFPPRRVERPTISMNQVGAALRGEHPGWAKPAVLFVSGANPAVTSVDQAAMLRGLADPDVFTVVHDQVMTDTAALADVVLPATTHFEADDVAGSYGSFTMQAVRKVIEPVGESWTNDQLAAALAQRLGFPNVVVPSADDYVRGGARVDLHVSRAPGQTVQFVDTAPAGGRIRLHVPDSELPLPQYTPLARGERLVLLTPATNRTINSMFAEFDPPDAVISLHPADAAARGVADGMVVRVSSERGEITIPARIDVSMRAGVCQIPKGLWLRHTGGEFTANVFAPRTESDLGKGACFNDALVSVASA